MSHDREPVEATIAELKPRMKNLSITFKVIEKGEAREVYSRKDNQNHRVLDARVGDPTGTVVVPLWDDMIERIEADATYTLTNGYTGLFQGHLRLNIGRYGEITDAEEPIEEVNTEVDMSEAEHERRPRRYDRRGGGGYSGGGRGRRDGGYGSGDRRRSY
ncbi:single-stranded DNA-binding protein [Candidatus Thorarchaeota archaeon]|jgi:replication factor A1|nr:MAG: single-stranded DNA-binding protein [Candidatus Thorarchaeota archaeon]